ncbi:MAG: hypothetical protein PF961_08400, partial [Planctomycetota bacterium]|nr:hypothetical protein [Planctomycetota bacterium]
MTPQRHGDTWLQAIPVDWPGFAGHFPGRPIVPAAELLAAACHCAADCGTATDQVRSARFLSPVAPGDHLNWH